MALTKDDIEIIKQVVGDSEGRLNSRMDEINSRIEDVENALNQQKSDLVHAISFSSTRLETKLKEKINKTEKNLTDLIELNRDMVDQKIKNHEAKHHTDRIV